MVCRPLLIPAFLLISTTVFAHGGGHYLLNTATAIDDSRGEVKKPGGAVSGNLTKEAGFKDRGSQESNESPAAGNRAVIQTTKENKTLTATEVHSYSIVKHVPVVTQYSVASTHGHD
jgi:hypothetical protein